MNTRTNGNPEAARKVDSSVREVVRSAEQELRQLLQQRAEIMKRIGTLKQTLAGLANVFGDSMLDDELLVLLERKPGARRPGFTRTCRMILMNSVTPLGAHQICERLRQGSPDLLDRHKKPLASVTTVLARLVDYAEVRTFLQADGDRVWEWITDANCISEAPQVALHPEDGVASTQREP